MEVTAKGVGGLVKFDGHFVSITHKGVLGRLTVGKGEKRIPVSSITAVQIKPPGAMVNGFISFTLPGSNEKRSSFGRQSFDAAGDENSIVFTKDQAPSFVALRDAVEQAIIRQSTPQAAAPAAAQPGRLEQLKTLGELRDSGVLSDEEFELEKTKLMEDSGTPVAEDTLDSRLEDGGTEEPEDERSGRRRPSLARVAGAVATGGLSEAARLGKKGLKKRGKE